MRDGGAAGPCDPGAVHRYAYDVVHTRVPGTVFGGTPPPSVFLSLAPSHANRSVYTRCAHGRRRRDRFFSPRPRLMPHVHRCIVCTFALLWCTRPSSPPPPLPPPTRNGPRKRTSSLQLIHAFFRLTNKFFPIKNIYIIYILIFFSYKSP